MSNEEVLHNLHRLLDESIPFEPLSKPHNCHREIYQLMCDTWRRNDEERPTFWEIHSFISRKSLDSIGSSNNTNSNKRSINIGVNPHTDFYMV
jgi:hypothetical protein